jgi:5-methylcytosine-specific restriction endonuclease McrA
MKYIEREVRKAGNSKALAYYHARWTRDGAPLLDLLGAVVDHVEAFAGGGSNAIGNLASACNKCNGRKSAAAVAEWDKRAKERPVKGKYGEPQNWDGLSILFVLLAGRHADALTASEKAWLRALA